MRDGEYPFSPIIPQDQKVLVKRTFDDAVGASKAYDGTERKRQIVIDLVGAFERCAQNIAGETFETLPARDEYEGAIAAQVNDDHQPLNVRILLEIAIESFIGRLQSNDLDI
jgi:hypothetical protein